jgi:hypothetical protein
MCHSREGGNLVLLTGFPPDRRTACPEFIEGRERRNLAYSVFPVAGLMKPITCALGIEPSL